MMQRIARRFGLGALAGSIAAMPGLAQSADEKDRAVYHLNQPGGPDFAYYRQFLVNLRNHLDVVARSPFEIRIVMHGAGVELLRTAARSNPQIAASIDDLKLAGVRFEICRITLQRNSIGLDELYDASETDLVASGVVQVCRLQQQGFAYIKI